MVDADGGIFSMNSEKKSRLIDLHKKLRNIGDSPVGTNDIPTPYENPEKSADSYLCINREQDFFSHPLHLVSPLTISTSIHLARR